MINFIVGALTFAIGMLFGGALVLAGVKCGEQ